MADEPGGNLGDVAPRKKKGSFTTYLIIGIISVIVIAGVTLFTSGDDKANGSPGNGASPSTNTPVTIPQLKSSLDTLTNTVNGFGTRIASLETTIAGLVAPSVTQADITSLQTNIDSLTIKVDAIDNTTATFNVSSGLTYWLTKNSDDDIRLHILSVEDMTLVAEVTVFYDDPIEYLSSTYGGTLSAFYDEVGTDRDYVPNLIPYNSVLSNTIVCSNTTINITDWYWEQSSTAVVEHIIPYIVTTCYNTTVVLSDWEYSAVTFYTGSFEVTADKEFSGRIDYLPEDYDTISVKLLSSLETSSSSGNGGI